MRNKLIAALLSVAMVVSMAACGTPDNGGNNDNSQAVSDDGNGGSEGEKVLRFGTDSAPTGIFMPFYHNDIYNSYVTNNVFETLLIADTEGELQPALAKEWEVSDDGLTYTFHLQEGVKWHDGEPFTASDVAFAYNFIAQPGYNGYYGTYVSEIAGYDEVQSGAAETLSGIEVIDDNTVTITTTNVYSSALATLAAGNISIIPEHIWKDVDVATASDNTDLVRNPIGTGPFKMKEYKVDQYVALEANKDYWRGAPKLDELIYVAVNAETVQAQVLNGEIDVFRLNAVNDDDIAIYEDGGATVEFVLDNGYQAMQMNCQNEDLGNVTIRQAVAYALNRQGMVDALLYGHGNVANTVYASSFWANPGDENLSCFEYNPEKAVELFESQGYTFEGTIGESSAKMLNPDGEQVSWRLFVPNNNEVRKASGTVIQDNLSAIGIDIDLEVMEFATIIDALQKIDEPDRFELALTGYTMGFDPDISMLVTSDGGNNYACFSDETIDGLVAEALATADQTAKEEIYKNLAVEISEKLPLLYLYNQESAYAVRDGVTIAVSPYSRQYQTWTWDVE